MSAIAGQFTSRRVALALGTIGVGALVGTAVAGYRDQGLGRGALYGGIAAAAGISLLFGGAYAWNRFSAARSGAGAGAAQLSTTFPRITALGSPVASAAPAAATAPRLSLLPASSYFQAAPSVAVPSFARTPPLPVATSTRGGAFLDALRGFFR